VLDTITAPRMPLAASTRRSIGSFHATSAGASNADASLMDLLAPYTHRPPIWR
jgi:hypothetical protein